MIIKPNNMSRRNFLRNVLGITTALILPARPRILMARDGHGGLYFPAGDTQGLYSINFNRDEIWIGIKRAGEAAGVWGQIPESDREVVAWAWADEKRFVDVKNHFFLDYFRKNNPTKAFALC